MMLCQFGSDPFIAATVLVGELSDGAQLVDVVIPDRSSKTLRTRLARPGFVTFSAAIPLLTGTPAIQDTMEA